MDEGLLSRPAYAGVDTHRDTNTLALLDGALRVLGTWRFPTGEAGYAELAERIGDPAVPVGVEGTCSYGAGLTRHLRGAGYDVYEVGGPRRAQRRRGKSDPIDAVAAARNLAAGDGLAPKELEGACGDVAWLMDAREQLVRRATAASNCVKSMLVRAPDDVRRSYAGMAVPEMMAALAGSRARDACRRSMRALAKRWVEDVREAGAIEAELAGLVAEACPALAGAFGVGAISAARLIVAAGSNPGRMGSEAAFSMLCGTSPVPASSGRTDRFRLNRGGDRQANRAIHEIALARMSKDDRTRRYIEKKTSEGKTKREAVRCLCRYIAREVYKLMTGPQEPLPDRVGLARRRRALGIAQSRAAELLGSSPQAVSRLERGVTVDGALLRRYDALLCELEAAQPAESCP